MTTIISPSNGEGVLYTQQGAGTTPGYAALDDRRMGSGALQEGVYGTATTVSAGGVSSVAAADFMVTQRASGANMSVDINMPAGGFAWVQGDTINGQGLYGVPVASANVNEVLAAADTSNPRIDSIILEVQDNVLDASGGNLSQTRVLTGAPSSGATLTNRTGAVTLPGNALLLADVLVAANGTSVANSAIRDRRKWARGASRTISGSNAGDFTTSSTTLGSLGSGAFDVRLELGGGPVDIHLNCEIELTSVATVEIALSWDGGSPRVYRSSEPLANGVVRFPVYAQIVLASGSHSFAVKWAVIGSTTATMNNSSNDVPAISYREVVRQDTVNNAVTSG